MRNKRNLIFIAIAVCVLCVGGYFFSQPKTVKQDIDLNVGQWNDVYTVDGLYTKKGTFFSIINGGNNDDVIRVRVLDENKEVVCEPMLVQLGRQVGYSQRLKNGYVMQAQPITVNGNYRVVLLQHRFKTIS